MSTIVKTGCRLLTYYQSDPPRVLYGDLHVVGNCAIMYYPPNQGPWQEVSDHGTLTYGSDGDEFQRDGSPFNILVVPADRIILKPDALHPLDMGKWVTAGGLIVGCPY
jgi:hypothetical protein